MRKTYTTPAGEYFGEYSPLYLDMAKQPHCLIAGATGSGKSTVINGILNAILYNCAPCRAAFILIDPKRVELAACAGLPHTVAHARGYNPEKWLQALQYACMLMDRRYMDMEKRRIKMYDGPDIYVIIDEWANVYKSGGAACYKAVLRLISEGRAARVHVIAATQVPKASIIPTEIRENFTARVCMRCNTKAQSRVLMDVDGCERLPEYGYGFYITPRGKDLYKLPLIDEIYTDRLIAYWEGPAGKGRIAR